MFGLDVLSIHTIGTFAIRTMFALPFLDFIHIILEIDYTIETFATRSMITLITSLAIFFVVAIISDIGLDVFLLMGNV